MASIYAEIEKQKQRMRTQCSTLSEMVGMDELLTFVGKRVEENGETRIEVDSMTPEEYARAAEPTERLYDEFSNGYGARDRLGMQRAALMNYNRALDKAITHANSNLR